MDETDVLKSSNISIVGLGLMGGSLALALHNRCKSLTAVDPNPEVRSLAIRQKIVDRVYSHLGDGISQADVIIISSPVGSILEIIPDLPSVHPGNPIILDIGSTKSEILQAMAKLPPRFDPLGGHPICGKEKLSLTNANRELFKGAPFAFTPLPRTSDKARTFANQLAETIGARPVWLDPEIHDHALATTSHAPYLIAAALALVATPDLASLVGPGFRSVSRLASTPASMMVGVLKTNQYHILEAVEEFQDQLDRLVSLLKLERYSELESALDNSSKQLADLDKVLVL